MSSGRKIERQTEMYSIAEVWCKPGPGVMLLASLEVNVLDDVRDSAPLVVVPVDLQVQVVLHVRLGRVRVDLKGLKKIKEKGGKPKGS